MHCPISELRKQTNTQTYWGRSSKKHEDTSKSIFGEANNSGQYSQSGTKREADVILIYFEFIYSKFVVIYL